MSNKTEVLMCPTCGVETHHVVVLVRKKSGYEGDKNRNKKEFIAGFLKFRITTRSWSWQKQAST